MSGVDFAKTNKSEYDRIMNTNDLRDDLIHLKRTNKSNNTAYQDLFKRLYDYNQFKNSEAVYRFLDTLKPNYFETKKWTYKYEKSRKVYYSKYKTTAFFYSRGEYIVEMFDDDTFKLTNPNGKERCYDVKSSTWA